MTQLPEETKENNSSNNKSTYVVNKNGPSVLILGGCGFIGRNLVSYLVTNKLVSSLRIVDKRSPFTSYFTPELLELYKNPIIKMIQCDLSKEQYVIKKEIFNVEVDYIINLCGETRFGQSENDYVNKCLDTAKLSAKLASKNLKKLKKWIEISTSQIYEPCKEKPCKETHKISPWTKLAKYRYEVEKQLSLYKLPIVTLRPAIVYGPGDKTGIMPRLVCGVCYKHANEKMTFLWTKNLCINTVHVSDVASAIWIACKEGKIGKIYNLSDKGNTRQGLFNDLLEKLFNIKCGFQNTAMNAAAKKMMTYATQVSNDKHLPMWSKVQKEYNLTNTPLSPYLDEEILTKNYLQIDGTLIEKETSFKYKIPKINVKLLKQMCDEYSKQGFYPNIDKMDKNKKTTKKGWFG